MPLTQASLTVNAKTIAMQEFIQEFLSGVISGILSALKAPADVRQVRLAIRGGSVDITVNGEDVPLNPFVNDFVRDTVSGMVSSLRDVDKPINSLEIDLS